MSSNPDPIRAAPTYATLSGQGAALARARESDTMQERAREKPERAETQTQHQSSD